MHARTRTPQAANKRESRPGRLAKSVHGFFILKSTLRKDTARKKPKRDPEREPFLFSFFVLRRFSPLPVPLLTSTSNMSGEEEDKSCNGAALAEAPAPVLDEDYVKHPLNNDWGWWFFKNDKSRNWADNLKFIAEVGTVEDFWGLYNHVQPVSGLPSVCDYSFFKRGIEPMWEDKQNVQGGRWLLQTAKNSRDKLLDTYWLETLLLLVGERFAEDADEVCGAVVQIRNRGDKLAIWTRDFTKKESVLRIGRIFKAALNLPADVVIGYQSHRENASKTSSNCKNIYTL